MKSEPHTIDKVQMGRFRIIAVVSFCDEIIERIIAENQNNKEIDNWKTIPSMPGISLSDDASCVFFRDRVRTTIPNLAEADVSAWDWSLSEWMFRWDAERRCQLMGLPSGSPLSNLVHNRAICLSRKVFSLSDGRLFSQGMKCYGVMPSGSYLTSSTNSAIRVMLGWLAGAEVVYAMGDDSLESFVASAPETYARFGIRLKMYKCVNGDFEFCSHLFTSSCAIPLSWAKTTFRLLSQTPSQEFLHQFRMVLRHAPQLPDIENLLDFSGWKASLPRSVE